MTDPNPYVHIPSIPRGIASEITVEAQARARALGLAFFVPAVWYAGQTTILGMSAILSDNLSLLARSALYGSTATVFLVTGFALAAQRWAWAALFVGGPLGALMWPPTLAHSITLLFDPRLRDALNEPPSGRPGPSLRAPWIAYGVFSAAWILTRITN